MNQRGIFLLLVFSTLGRTLRAVDTGVDTFCFIGVWSFCVGAFSNLVLPSPPCGNFKKRRSHGGDPSLPGRRVPTNWMNEQLARRTKLTP